MGFDTHIKRGHPSAFLSYFPRYNGIDALFENFSYLWAIDHLFNYPSKPCNSPAQVSSLLIPISYRSQHG